MNPAVWLDRAARLWPGRPALFHGETPVADYAGFAARAGALAAGLLREGIGPGDRVALFLSNHPDYLVAMQAIWWIGAAVVPVNAKLHEKEAAYIFSHSGASLALTDTAHRGNLDTLTPAVRIVDILGSEFAALVGSTLSPPLHPMNRDDLIWLFYTSGTTGRPKGVMLTPGNIATMVLSYFADVDAVSESDAKVYAAPMSHGAGLYQFMYLIRGARHVVPTSGGFDSDEILDLAASLGDLCFFAAPTMVRRLVAAARARGSRGEGIRTVVYGGGPMYLADIRDAMTLMGPRFVQIYGQGESPMTITVLTRDAHVEAAAGPDDAVAMHRLGSVGVAQAGCEVAVLGPDCAPLKPGEIGEIAVRGTSVMKGYWQDPVATEAAIREGWLHTGDVGALDEVGFLTMHDRSKDVIISGGTNIYPREVEEALLTHPAVAEVSVIGRRDPEWGEEVFACVVLEPGATAGIADLDAHCLTQIARFKRPKDYAFLPDLPKNAYGKVLKTELRLRFAYRERHA